MNEYFLVIAAVLVHSALDLVVQNFLFTGAIGIPLSSVYGSAFAFGLFSTSFKLIKASLLYREGQRMSSNALVYSFKNLGILAIAIVVYKTIESNIDNFYMNGKNLTWRDVSENRSKQVEIALSIMEGIIGPVRQILSKDASR